MPDHSVKSLHAVIDAITSLHETDHLEAEIIGFILFVKYRISDHYVVDAEDLSLPWFDTGPISDHPSAVLAGYGLRFLPLHSVYVQNASGASTPISSNTYASRSITNVTPRK